MSDSQYFRNRFENFEVPGTTRVALKNSRTIPFRALHPLFRSSHCYITFHEYSVVICIRINPQ